MENFSLIIKVDLDRKSDGELPEPEYVDVTIDSVEDALVSLCFDTVNTVARYGEAFYECSDLNVAKSKVIVDGEETDVLLSQSNIKVSDLVSVTCLKVHCRYDDDIQVQRVLECALVTDDKTRWILETKGIIIVTRFGDGSYELPDGRVELTINTEEKYKATR